MKISFNRALRRTPWGGGSQFLAVFADYLVAKGHQVVHQLEPNIDVVVMLDPRPEDGGFSANEILTHKKRNAIKVLHRVNDTGVTRGGDTLDRLISNANAVLADQTVFISEWVRNHFVAKGFDANRPHTVITNGCDETFFYPRPQVEKPGRPLKLVTHHWSDNPAKGLDLYAEIDRLIDGGAPLEFTYVGRYPKGHSPKHTRIVAPLYGQQLGDELRKHDVYVTGARWEACGSHHVEGAACGLPVVYHLDGGGVVEMCQRYGVGVSSPSELRHAITTVASNYATHQKAIMDADLKASTMCEKYLRIIENMMSS